MIARIGLGALERPLAQHQARPQLGAPTIEPVAGNVRGCPAGPNTVGRGAAVNVGV